MHVPFENEYREQFQELLTEVFDSGFWSQGNMQKRFEEDFGKYIKLESRAVSSGGAGLLAIFQYIDVAGKDVIVPANTFWATAQAAKLAGANVIYADCNKDDLCLSLDDLKKKVTPETKAVCVVHIGGHIAFEIEEIAAFCNEKGIQLVEDCAHVHGGWWNGKTGGHWGLAGSYSFYATKTMPLGDAGMVVSKDKDFLDWLEKYRNYGKEIVGGVVTYPIKTGFNYRINEFTAALGVLQVKRLPVILEWKKNLAEKYDKIFERTVKFPSGMESGYYKYIVFDYPELKEKTGTVFGPLDLGSKIEGIEADIPNSIWVTENHQCPPIWYGWEKADLDIAALKSALL
jgi:dTDP-4-amino-4,6-dideoxygalactose transaminase